MLSLCLVCGLCSTCHDLFTLPLSVIGTHVSVIVSILDIFYTRFGPETRQRKGILFR